MKNLKHVGKIKNTGSKVLVVFRTLPGESNMALVLPVANLTDSYHDSIMTVVETDQAQETFEFGEIMLIFMAVMITDIILLDLMLPEVDGISIARRVMQKNPTPIIMTTARESLNDRLRGFETGAVDYLVKPFDL